MPRRPPGCGRCCPPHYGSSRSNRRRFGVERLGHLLPHTHNRCSCADCADWRHPDMFRSECDQRARRAGIRIDVGVSWSLDLHQRLKDVDRGAEFPARRVHVENVGGGIGRLPGFENAAQEEKLRFGDLAFQGNDDHCTLGDRALELAHFGHYFSGLFLRISSLRPNAGSSEEEGEEQCESHNGDLPCMRAALKSNRTNSRALVCPLRYT